MEKKPLIQHLEELRRRLFFIAVSVFTFSIISFFIAHDLYEILKYPALKYYPNLQFVTLSPSSAFFVLMKISLIAGIVFSFPVIFYHLWKFVEPGLLPSEKRLLIPLLSLGIFLFVTGILFAYFAVLPVALKFLIGLGIDLLKVTPMISIDLYTSFVLKLVLAFGFLFQLPIVMYILTAGGIVKLESWEKWRKPFIVASFVIGALIAPDWMTQTLIALPLIVLYEISLRVNRYLKKKRKIID
ncbi:MAG TPA: twin-arginine translocase subunit TatC [Aquifex sp.]|uniref:Sec-independent protein translocase protein TatC n=1 Tax=Aquifex aeolicus TaxID=63363 RepID=A0A9D0YPI8_AQUAO|nr:twin-arginine translocase subunit TatC [Aquifex sp.]HIP98601.1 twin-arginine translocase subunit TatC [Aquifex aeolicus]